MKRTLLSRLRTTGICCIVSALLFLLGIPLYQGLALTPLGYGDALAAASQHFPTFLTWVGAHTVAFVFYRVLLLLAFGLLLGAPFNLFRIIVAQEIIGQQEEDERLAAQEVEEDESDEAVGGEAEEDVEDEGTDDATVKESTAGTSVQLWRGKGFAVLAAWAGFIGIVLYLLGTIASTLYLVVVSSGFTPRSPVPGSFSTLYGTFAFSANTVGIGLLALSALFFGAVIARRGRNLWPGIWVLFGYTALAVAALLSGSAVAVASAPTAGQAALTTPAIILFALWNLWFGIMLVRLKPEP